MCPEAPTGWGHARGCGDQGQAGRRWAARPPAELDSGPRLLPARGGTARPRGVAAGAVSGRTGVRGPLGDVVREGRQLLCDGRAGHCCHLRH